MLGKNQADERIKIKRSTFSMSTTIKWRRVKNNDGHDDNEDDNPSGVGDKLGAWEKLPLRIATEMAYKPPMQDKRVQGVRKHSRISFLKLL